MFCMITPSPVRAFGRQSIFSNRYADYPRTNCTIFPDIAIQVARNSATLGGQLETSELSNCEVGIDPVTCQLNTVPGSHPSAGRGLSLFTGAQRAWCSSPPKFRLWFVALQTCDNTAPQDGCFGHQIVPECGLFDSFPGKIGLGISYFATFRRPAKLIAEGNDEKGWNVGS